MSDDEEPKGHPKIPREGIALGGLGSGDYDTSLRQPEEPLLPQGALVAMRKSGGLRFSSRWAVVYRSGRVERGSNAGLARAAYLEPAALRALWRLTLRSRLALYEGLKSQAGPDAYSYELAAQVGRNLREVQLQTGSIPPRMEALVRVMEKLLPD